MHQAIAPDAHINKDAVQRDRCDATFQLHARLDILDTAGTTAFFLGHGHIAGTFGFRCDWSWPVWSQQHDGSTSATLVAALTSAAGASVSLPAAARFSGRRVGAHFRQRQ